MAKKKTSQKKGVKVEELKPAKTGGVKISKREVPDTMKIATERDIVMDFGSKVYKKFDKMIKSVVLFGSSAKRTATSTSDIDVILIVDDVAIDWEDDLIGWYREELGDIIRANPYRKILHINTVKLSTWWQDLLRGDPIVINIIRYGDPIIDFGGFFTPLKVLLQEGKIKPTPESIYTLLQRAPQHIARARASVLSIVDGLYWALVDSAHAALIAAGNMPSSPENIADVLTETFVNKKLLDKEYVDFYSEIHSKAKDIVHRRPVEIKGDEINKWFDKTDEFIEVMAKLIDEIIKKSD